MARDISYWGEIGGYSTLELFLASQQLHKDEIDQS